MKITKRQSKWNEWYETEYWRGGDYRYYQTKSLSDHHSVLHDRAKQGGYQAITTRYHKDAAYLGTYGEEIRVTNRGQFAR